MAVVGAPFAAIGAFLGLVALGAWLDVSVSAFWAAPAMAAVAGWGALIGLGERLGIDRIWTGTGVVLATLATPAWAFGAVFLLVSIYCPEAGCFN